MQSLERLFETEMLFRLGIIQFVRDLLPPFFNTWMSKKKAASFCIVSDLLIHTPSSFITLLHCQYAEQADVCAIGYHKGRQ